MVSYWQTSILGVDWHYLSEQSLLVKLKQISYKTLETMCKVELKVSQSNKKRQNPRDTII